VPTLVIGPERARGHNIQEILVLSRGQQERRGWAGGGPVSAESAWLRDSTGAPCTRMPVSASASAHPGAAECVAQAAARGQAHQCDRRPPGTSLTHEPGDPVTGVATPAAQ